MKFFALLAALEPAVQAEVGRGMLPSRLAQELTRLPRGNTDQLRMLSLVQQHRLTCQDNHRQAAGRG
jgi:hypothetical protein